VVVDAAVRALALIDAMTRDALTGTEFTDHYTEALHEVIEAKQEGHRLPKTAAPVARPGQLVDLMAALQESVDTARAARGEGGGAVHRPPAKKTARPPSGKKTSSRKPRPRA
jgi:DNA end-binding protein Ku